MAQKRKILFIINPASGTRSKKNVPALLEKYLNNAIDYNVMFTSYPGDATEISRKNKMAYDVIVAVGGDGTINEVARPLINTEAMLGILPVGSGNGLARHLGIPLNIKNAIKLLNQPHHTKIDTVKADDRVFLNVAGVGFDAHIANIFGKSKKRGFFTYAKLTLQELRKFKYSSYKLIIDEKKKIEDAPFLISIANATQYGNNAYIAPAARIADGFMDICILQKVPFWYHPILISHLFKGSIEKSKYYSRLTGKEVTIQSTTKTSYPKSFHLDGDAFEMKQEITLSIQPLSLKVACLPVSA